MRQSHLARLCLLTLAAALGACGGGSASPTGGAGTGGGAGTSGDAGTTGAAGSGAAGMGGAGMGAAGTGAQTANADLVRACMLNNACGFQSSMQLPADLCVKGMLDLLMARATVASPEEVIRNKQAIECARTATTCDAYVSCVRFGGTCSGTVKGSCQGTIADRCSAPGANYLPPVFDCGTLQMTCDASGSSAMCVLPAGSNDCADASAARCDGTTRVFCRPRAGGGFGEIRDPCPDGTVCMASSNSAGCLAAYGTCDTQGARCDGSTARICAKQGGMMLEIAYDCAAAGRKCALDAKGVAGCVPMATACTPATGGGTSGRCDGNTLEVCVEGKLERLDCASVGRTTCMVTQGVPGVTPPAPTCM